VKALFDNLKELRLKDSIDTGKTQPIRETIQVTVK